MKKTILFMCLAGLILSVQAQETDGMVSKKGIPILPEQGDIAVAINAVPIFNFIGNMFNGTVGNTVGWSYMSDWTNSNSIYLQYYLEENVSARVGFRFANNQAINQEFVVKDEAPIPDPDVLVTDKLVTNNTNLNLNAHYLMHRGKGRVQGYYGAGIALMYRTNSQKYTYGNPITSTFTSPETHDFGANITGSGRITEVKNIVSIGAGLQAVIGVEYFVAPKFSIGGEFGYGVMFIRNNGGTLVEERWNGLEIETEETVTANDGGIYLDNTNFGGGIYLKFHF
ncbi:MAG: hypothetical protein RBR24_10385 [Candidatus Carbobacillus sp.]|jgi:hypothetical protein|nr:hypothetical protein [Bacteroidales bacterium]MDD4235769.1 hypothetical protein [Bacteroidales bacterium]MDY0160557.1 hypothetical protein [Bacteroidales bacterium]MDY0324402.1 hypothetical protein [Candidatus Carbobacillus sp.]